MPEQEPNKNLSGIINFLLLAGIVAIALNLRPAIAVVGPLIGDIRESTGLSNSLLGLLTTLPLIAFGIISSFTPLFTRRFGIGGTLLGAMALLTLGIGLRSVGSIFLLYLGTLFLGIAIAFGNVLLPSITKRNFAAKSGMITSLYSSVMAVGAALGAGLSVPVSEDLGLGWQISIGVWGILSLIAFFIWIPQVNNLKKSVQKGSYLKAMKLLGKSKLAWQVALFMGLQSFTFYVILAWLPEILQSRGYDAHYAGWMLSLTQATGILGSIIIPTIAGKKSDQRSIVLFLFIFEIIALLGLVFPELGMVWLWVSLLGFILGGTFGLSLLFIVLRSTDTDSATELSGMVQSIGYLIAATGPIIFGMIFDFTGNWTYSLILLLGIVTFKLWTGLGAAKPGKV